MRLVDADKLLPKLWVCYEENKPIVDAEPTVKAIPVEWIERWLNNIKNDSRYENNYFKMTDEIKNIVYKGEFLTNVPCVSDMLEDWEAEQNECRGTDKLDESAGSR